MWFGSSLGLLWLLTGCAFDPPSSLPIPPEFQDGGSGLLDGGAGDTGLPPDAGPVDGAIPDGASPDAEPDGGPGDGGLDDGGVPDTGLPDTGVDAGLPDTGIDAGLPDTGLDAGLPDTGIDAGCGLRLPASPSVVTTIEAQQAIDTPVLLFDADNDGREEIIVADVANDQISVIDVDSCGAAVVTTRTNVQMDRDGPIGVFQGGQPALIVADSGRVEGFRYSGGATPTLTPDPSLLDTTTAQANLLTGDPAGDSFMVSGRTGGGAWAFWAYTNAFSRTESTLTDELPFHAAFYAPAGGGLSSFAGVDTRSGILLLPGSNPEYVPDMGAVPASDVITFKSGSVPGTSDVLMIYGANNGSNEEIRMALIDPLDPTSQSFGSAALTNQFISSPMLMTRPRAGMDDELLMYYVRDDNRFFGCAFDLNNGFDCVPVTANAINIGGMSSSANITPISAYVNANDVPDVILAERDGAIQFRTYALSVAAPNVVLGEDIVGTPAASTAFYDRFGQNGTLLVVPHADGTLSLIGWQTPALAGPASRLWMQHRRDAHRSGSL